MNVVVVTPTEVGRALGYKKPRECRETLAEEFDVSWSDGDVLMIASDKAAIIRWSGKRNPVRDEQEVEGEP
jgi:hypothetical protein